MPGIIYNSCLDDEARGAINFNADDFAVMLVGAGYVPDKDHSRRSDITDEVTGTGYVSGGQPVSVTVEKDNVNDRVLVHLGGASWPTSTISAAGAVYYKKRGGAAAADELVSFIDFTQLVVSNVGTFTLTDSTLRKSQQ